MKKPVLFLSIGTMVLFSGCLRYPTPITKADAERHYLKKQQEKERSVAETEREMAKVRLQQKEYRENEREYSDMFEN